MTKHWTPLAICWLGLSIAGLLGSWVFTAVAIIQRRDLISDWFASGPAVSALTLNLLVLAVAAIVFMIVEARRIGMRFGWLYVLLSAVTALSFAFPLFLAIRERTLAARRASGERSLDL
jgi:hypothetical protein